MTKMLKKALAEVAKLSEEEQNALAAWLLEELASERRWERLFASSSDKLAALADAALTEHKRGRTHKLDPNRL